MLTNTVIKVTFGDLRAQQISVINFQCGVTYHTEFGVPLPNECSLVKAFENMNAVNLIYRPCTDISVSLFESQ